MPVHWQKQFFCLLLQRGFLGWGETFVFNTISHVEGGKINFSSTYVHTGVLQECGGPRTNRAVEAYMPLGAKETGLAFGTSKGRKAIHIEKKTQMPINKRWLGHLYQWDTGRTLIEWSVLHSFLSITPSSY